MSNYGTMTSYDDAIEFVKSIEPIHKKDIELKERTINRMMYERDKTQPVKPTFHKGMYGKKFDNYTCGHCGAAVSQIGWNYCPNCGFKIGWDSIRCLTK